MFLFYLLCLLQKCYEIEMYTNIPCKWSMNLKGETASHYISHLPGGHTFQQRNSSIFIFIPQFDTRANDKKDAL